MVPQGTHNSKANFFYFLRSQEIQIKEKVSKVAGLLYKQIISRWKCSRSITGNRKKKFKRTCLDYLVCLSQTESPREPRCEFLCNLPLAHWKYANENEEESSGATRCSHNAPDGSVLENWRKFSRITCAKMCTLFVGNTTP